MVAEVKQENIGSLNSSTIPDA